MNRRFRLTKTKDFQRVRRDGQSYAHPLLVLIHLVNDSESSRFGIIAGKSIGNAVKRNKVKRRIRSILSDQIPEIKDHQDMIFIARKRSADATFDQLKQAVYELIKRASLLTGQE